MSRLSETRFAGAAETFDAPLKCLGYQQFLHADMAAATHLTVPADTRLVEFQVAIGSVRVREDGTNPTTTLGMLYEAGTVKALAETDFSAFAFIDAGGDGQVNVQYYGYA